MSPTAVDIGRVRPPSAAPPPGGGPLVPLVDFLAFTYPAGGDLTCKGYSVASGYESDIASIAPSFTNIFINGATPTPHTDYGLNMVQPRQEFGLQTRSTCFFPRVLSGGTDHQVLAMAFENGGVNPSSKFQSHLWLWDIGNNAQTIIDLGSTTFNTRVSFFMAGEDLEPYVAVQRFSTGPTQWEVQLYSLQPQGITSVAGPINSVGGDTIKIAIEACLGDNTGGTPSYRVLCSDADDEGLTVHQIALPGGAVTTFTAGEPNDPEAPFNSAADHGIAFMVADLPSWAADPNPAPLNREGEYDSQSFTYSGAGLSDGMNLVNGSWDEDLFGVGFAGFSGGASALNTTARPQNDVPGWMSVSYDGLTMGMSPWQIVPGSFLSTMKTLDMTAIGNSDFNAAPPSYNLVSNPASTASEIPHFAVVYGI